MGVAVSPPITLTVQDHPQFTADSPPSSGLQGVAYPSYTFTATGTPTPTYTVTSGALPPGLSLNPTSGVLAGTPTASGMVTFTVTASNGIGAPATSPPITIAIRFPAPPVLTSDTPPTGAATGVAYPAYTFNASGTPPPTYTVTSGALPPGLSLNPTSGVLAGTPTTVGSFTFTISATNGVGSPGATSPSITIVVTAAVAPVFTAASPSPHLTLGVPYSYTFAASGNPAPIFGLDSGTLPLGITLNPATGVFAGTPVTASGSFGFRVSASNGAPGSPAVTPQITISVSANAPGAVALTPASLTFPGAQAEGTSSAPLTVVASAAGVTPST